MEKNRQQGFSKLYWEGVQRFLDCDAQKLKRCIYKCEDSREKKLLSVRLCMLESKFDAALDICFSISEFLPYVKAEKHLQLATLYSLKNQHELALSENLKALEYFKNTKEPTKSLRDYL